jgi:hypothetical protein
MTDTPVKDLFIDNDKSYLVYRLKDGKGTAQIAYNHGGWAYLLVNVCGTFIWLYIGSYKKIQNLIETPVLMLTPSTNELQPANLFESEIPYPSTCPFSSLEECVESGFLIRNSDGSYRRGKPTSELP